MAKKFKDKDGDVLFQYNKVKSIPIDPELMAIKPFIVPVKGFSYDEVLSMIQSVINKHKK